MEGLVSDNCSSKLSTAVSSDEKQLVKPKGMIKGGYFGVRRVVVQS